jgi:hypothetical protein
MSLAKIILLASEVMGVVVARLPYLPLARTPPQSIFTCNHITPPAPFLNFNKHHQSNDKHHVI